MLFDERDGRHHKSRRTEAAHQRVAIAEGLLYWMERRPVGQAVDRTNLLALDFDRKRRARVGGPAVDDHRAGAAHPAVAAALVAGEIRLVTQGIEQRHARLDVQIQPFAVDHQLDWHIARTGDRRPCLRVGDGGSGYARDERDSTYSAGRLQEIAAASVDLLGFLGIFVPLSHEQALRQKGTPKPREYSPSAGCSAGLQACQPPVQLGGLIRFFEDRDELIEGRDCVPGGVDDGPAFLQGWLRPAFVFDVHAPVTVDLDDGGVHGLDKQFHTPAAADAFIASSTPSTTAAEGSPSPPPP